MLCIHRMESVSSKVLCLMQAPALDVVAMGLQDGRIVLRNLRLDRTLFTLTQTHPVMDMSFRGDTAQHSSQNRGAAPQLVTANGAELTMWCMGTRRCLGAVPAAHEGGIRRVCFVPGTSVLLSSGRDNAVRQWSADAADTSGGNKGMPLRRLRERSGHSRPPHLVTWRGAGDDGDDSPPQLLTASRDTAIGADLRRWSPHRDEQNVRMTDDPRAEQRAPQRLSRAPPITALALERRGGAVARFGDFADVVTLHSNAVVARTWSTRRARQGRKLLCLHAELNTRRNADKSSRLSAAAAQLRQRMERLGKVEFTGVPHHTQVKKGKDCSSANSKVLATLTSCVVSRDGHSALIGDAAGQIAMFNLQSGKKKADAEHVHEGAVTSLHFDMLDTEAYSTSLDGNLVFHDLRQRQKRATGDMPCVHKLQLGAPISSAALQEHSGLLAAALELPEDAKGHAILVVDVNNRRIVRRFLPHSARVVGMSWSRDGRCLVVATADAAVRTVDVVAARVVDWVKFARPVTSVALSPKGDLLATTHAGARGVFLWTHRAYYTHVPLRSVDEPVMLPLHDDLVQPITSLDAYDDLVADGFASDSDSDGDYSDYSDSSDGDDSESDSDEDMGVAGNKQQSHSGMLTLSGDPRTRWMNLVQLEQIRERNKPKLPPKKPEQAPFFLPSTYEQKQEQAQNQEQKEQDDDEQRHDSTVSLLSRAQVVLLCEQGLYSEAFNYLRNMTPTQCDAELRSVAMDPAREFSDLTHIVRALRLRLEKRHDYDVVQSVMTALFAAHADVFLRAPRDPTATALNEELANLQKTQVEEWHMLEDLLMSCRCMGDWFGQLRA
ncbi:MAG: hypothetical protein MHM6MM_003238 [Cercozoa sp. M6MM]